MTDNSTKSDYNPSTWHPVRLPYSANGGKKAFPKLNAFTSREPEDMRNWIDEHCEHGWRHEIDSDKASVFWFENQSEAMNFALAWFPFKCL